MAGLCAPLPTLRRRPCGRLRTARGRCGSLLLHRKGLAPSTPCRSPGALRKPAQMQKCECESVERLDQGQGNDLRARAHHGPTQHPGCRGQRQSAWRAKTAHERRTRSEEHTSELQSRRDLVCRLLPEKKKQRSNSRFVKSSTKIYRVDRPM